MNSIEIRWQRLLDESSKTCDRCSATEQEIDSAVRTIEKCLAPLGIEVRLEKETLDVATFSEDFDRSNRIWINGKLLDEWLEARAGRSTCSFCCEAVGEEVECRTVEIDGRVYEAIPARLIVAAALRAASDLLLI